jgi:hypothetical protein
MFVANTFGIALASAAIAWVGISFAAPAVAEPAKTFKAAFHYSPEAPAGVTYAGLKDQARKACMTESRSMTNGPLASRVRWVQRCESDLVGKVVDAINQRDLIALHEENRASGQVASR